MKDLATFSCGWRWKSLLFIHLIVGLGWLSVFYEGTAPIWQSIDRMLFLSLNYLLWALPILQSIMAWGNIWVGTIVLDVFLILLSVLVLLWLPASKRRQAFACFFLMVASLIFTLGFLGVINNMLTRPSPLLYCQPFIELSQSPLGCKVPGGSLDSFPSGHGIAPITAFISILLMGWGRFSWGWAALCLLGVLPRLFIGRHGFADVFVGSAGFIVICAAWMFCTPLYSIVNRCFGGDRDAIMDEEAAFGQRSCESIG